MADSLISSKIPVPEPLLRDLGRDLALLIPNFEERESRLGVKDLHTVLEPLLTTAESADLASSHRAAVCNVLCAILEKCQESPVQYARDAVLDDFIWLRLFSIYLERSDNAKGKSVRQLLLTLTGALLKSGDPRALQLRHKGASTFLEIICGRQDRLKVKPALQGLAHFLQKDISSIPELVDLYSHILKRSGALKESATLESLFTCFLLWIVHRDTSLSAGHLVKNFLAQIRRSPAPPVSQSMYPTIPIWLEPVVNTLHLYPDCIQEFKTHVFPYCFLPYINEYLLFLSRLHFGQHVRTIRPLPDQLNFFDGQGNALDESEQYRILLASIEAGKELGIIVDTEDTTIKVYRNTLQLPDTIFGPWMSHTEGDVRLAGLFLLVYSTAVTRPVTPGVLEFLKKNLVHFHADTDANFRREFLGYIQKLFDRLRGSTSTLAKKSKTTMLARDWTPIPLVAKGFVKRSRSRPAEDTLLESVYFITWYVRFLRSELRTEASYQRRITALRALYIVLKSGVDPNVPHHLRSKSAQGQLQWAFGMRIVDQGLMRLLLDFVLDPYDDIRDTSASVLRLCLESMSNNERSEFLSTFPRFLSRAEAAMLSTGRADQADGVARAYSLFFSADTLGISEQGHLDVTCRVGLISRLTHQLHSTLDVAQRNLSEAVNGRPVHGIFAAIRYIVDHEQFYAHLERLPSNEFLMWKQAHDAVIGDLQRLWSCVCSVLCADAPEGHIPEEMEEEDSLDTKEILSYSWRGLKEASILLRAIVSKAPIGRHDKALITPDTFKELGRLCFTQLVDLRHRGAFSTVAQTFAAFCRRCLSTDDPMLRALPGEWYQETLRSIQAKAAIITRRSGGIPSMMAGIIAAGSQHESGLFARAMRDLVGEATVEAESSNIEESRLPQVHAMNCVKEIFTSSRLSVPSEAYLGDGLELAASTMNSRIWPIRNCSLMLFKALIERLLGSDEAQDWKERDRTRTSRFSYNNYPSLVGILQRLLNPEGPLKKSLIGAPHDGSPMDLHGAEGVFPALQILRQASPPKNDRLQILELVEKLLSSPHWHLRDMAARTVTSLYRPQELLPCVKLLIHRGSDAANAKHGALLCLKHMLRKGIQVTPEPAEQYLGPLMIDLCQGATAWCSEPTCPFTTSAYLDLVSVCGMAMLQKPKCEGNIEAWARLTASLSVGPEHILNLENTLGSALLRASQGRLFFIDRVIVRPDCVTITASNSFQTIGDALLFLEKEDPDTCTAALDTLNVITQLKVPKGPLLHVPLILLQIFTLVRHAEDPEIASQAQAVLADGLSRDGMVEGCLSLIGQDDMAHSLKILETQCLEGAPSNMRSALRLLGFLLDWMYYKCPSIRHNNFHQIARYIRLLRMTVIDTNPFDTRFAAVQSILALEHLWHMSASSKATRPLLLGLSFALYDMLNDDDDEIRDAAASATAKLLNAQTPSHQQNTHEPTVPILASHSLARFLTSAFPNSGELCKESIRRLIGSPPHNPLFSTPFAETLADASKQDTALFSTEKQNLFKDETLDAVLWSRVLRSLSPSLCISSTLRAAFTDWVHDALVVLTSKAKSGADGALGWTAKPEVFTLGMRVLCAAQVVLKWDAGSAAASGTKVLLREFADTGRANELHGLWLDKIERVLEESVLEELRRVNERLARLQKAVGI